MAREFYQPETYRIIPSKDGEYHFIVNQSTGKMVMHDYDGPEALLLVRHFDVPNPIFDMPEDHDPEHFARKLESELYDTYQVVTGFHNGDLFLYDNDEKDLHFTFACYSVHVVRIPNLDEFRRGQHQAVSDFSAQGVREIEAEQGRQTADWEKSGRDWSKTTVSRSFSLGYSVVSHNLLNEKIGIPMVRNWPFRSL